MQRCRGGEVGAFEELYKRYGSRLYTVAYRMTGSAADAEDLVQDIFLQVYRRLDTYRAEAALGTWLHRIAVNACLDFLRSKQGRLRRVTDAGEDLDALEAPAAGPWRAGAALDRMDIERAIAQLPPSYRRAFLLHDVEGLEHHEIGETLGIAEGTSKSLLFKARTRLRVILRGRPGER
ncbi:MAG TPA: RNA polymerase sigma factor [Vicinamibacterales bacterium]|nr:RNA polymerase sigma factor [Vicinamibacterales bacterium]